MKSNFHIYQKLEPFIIKTINNLFKKMKKLSNRIENLYKINLFGFLGLIIYKIYQAPFTKLNNNIISETNLKLLGIEKFLKNNILAGKMDFTLKNSNWLKRNDYKFCISKYETLSIYKDKNYRNILYYVKQKINQNINADIKTRIYYLLNIYTLLFYNLNLTKKGDVLCTLK